MSNLKLEIPQPEITVSAVSNIIRNPNGPGGADDTVSFDVTISGVNGGTGWTTTGATPASGIFGLITLTVSAGGNGVTVRITDNTFPAAFQDVTVPLPGPYIIGQLNTGSDAGPVFTDAGTPPDAAWVIDAAARTLSMNDGDVPGAGGKVVTSEVLDVSLAAAPLRFTANLHVNDKTGGFEPLDYFVAVLIYDGDIANPVILTDTYAADVSGRMYGAELCPAPPVNPTVQNFDYPLSTVIPGNVNTVQLIVTGLNDSPNETMIVSGILLSPDAADADSDGDGQPNDAEILAGTDPNYANSALRSKGLTVDAATGAVTVTFASVAGKTYHLQSSPDLSAWTDTGSEITATGAVESISVTLPVRR